MDKLLSIIIPRYNETELELFPLLSSINNQVGIDFNQVEVIIVDDCSKKNLSPDLFHLFQNVHVRIIQNLQNGGPGVARQTGIDDAKGEYLLFCDADDLLHNIAVLGVYFEAIRTVTDGDEKQYDIIATDWLEELIRDNQIFYIPHTQESTWMHGKCIRRQYLIDKGIKFHPDFRVHEDSYFLSLAYAQTKNIKFIPVTTYLWRFSPNSITRRNGAEYTYTSMPEHATAIIESFKRLADVLDVFDMYYKILQYTCYVFFLVHRYDWTPPDKQHFVKKLEDTFVEKIRPLFDKFYPENPDFIKEVYNQERLKNFKDQIETETLDNWLTRIKLRR